MASPYISLTLSTTGEILAEIPGTAAVHSLRIAPGEQGMAQLYRLLIAQREKGLGTIGTQSAPTQKMIDNLDDERWDGMIQHLAPRAGVLRDAERKRSIEAAEELSLEDLDL